VLYDSLGAASVPAVATILALVGSGFAPMLVVRRLAASLGVLAIVLGAIAMLVPTTAPSHPRHQSLAHVTNADTGAASWLTEAPLPLVRAAAHFTRAPVAPWYGARGLADVAPAPAIALAAPTVHVDKAQRDGAQIVTLELASQRAAPYLRLIWHSDGEIAAIRVNGFLLPPRPAPAWARLAPGWHHLFIRGSSARVEIVTSAPSSAQAIVRDGTFGLPAVAAPLRVLRDASGAVPVHDGDMTFVERRVAW